MSNKGHNFFGGDMDTVMLPFESAREDWQKLRITGTLRIERKHESHAIHVDIDILRCASTMVQCVDRSSLILDEQRYPITLLNFSSDALACLASEGIQTLAMLLGATHAFLARQDISSAIRDEVHAVLTNLGYIPLPQEVQSKQVAHEKESVEEPMVSVVTENNADNSVGLLKDFLTKSITALTLSPSTLMRLWGLNIETVNDLIGWEESRLVDALFAANGSRKRTAETACLRAVENAKERLGYFDLQFVPETKMHKGMKASKGFIHDTESLVVNPDIFSLQPEIWVSEEMAAEKLGDQYSLFKQFREAMGEEQILLRNKIAVVNCGLVGKFSTRFAPRIERRHVGMKIKEEALEKQDLFQEGAIGLLRGVELYDYRRGFAFSTYASSWIKQYIGRAIINQLHQVRIPAHLSKDVLQFIGNVDRVLYAWHARNPLQDPTREEIAQEIGIPFERFEEFLRILQFHYLHSLDERIEGDEGEADTLGDVIADTRYDPETLVMDYHDERYVQEVAHQLLAADNIKPINRQCVVLWFGLEGNREHTLKELSERFGVTHQRIQQRIAETLDILRTQENWEMASRAIPHLAKPSKIRKTDIVLRDTPYDRITRLERRNEHIAHDVLAHITEEYKVSGEVLRSGANIPPHLQAIRRHAIAEMYRNAKRSTGFIAFFFNLTHEMVEEEIAIFLTESAYLKGKKNQRNKLEWCWEAMKVIVQIAETGGFMPEQLFGPMPKKIPENDILAIPRHAAIIRLREELKLSLAEIAHFLSLTPEFVARSYARKDV